MLNKSVLKINKFKCKIFMERRSLLLCSWPKILISNSFTRKSTKHRQKVVASSILCHRRNPHKVYTSLRRKEEVKLRATIQRQTRWWRKRRNLSKMKRTLLAKPNHNGPGVATYMTTMTPKEPILWQWSWIQQSRRKEVGKKGAAILQCSRQKYSDK